MEFTSIYKNGKPDYFFIALDASKHEFNFVQPYYIVTDIDHTRHGRIREMNALVSYGCATQNEVDLEEAMKMIKNGTKYYVEVSNMPTTNDALEYLQENAVVAPSKAVNAGGVAVSALEMSQDSMRYSWSAEEVDEKLRDIMKNTKESAATSPIRWRRWCGFICCKTCTT